MAVPSNTYENQCLKKGENWYLQERHSDVHFIFSTIDEPYGRVPAHKTLLAIESDVFEAMFFGDLKEQGDVHVPDTSEAAFKEFLQFFYLSEVKLTKSNVGAVFVFGDKYNVKQCVIKSTDYMIEIVDADNACDFLALGMRHNSERLIKSCVKYIIANTEAVLKSDGFADCEKPVLEHILKMNVMSCTESELFEACMTWVQRKSQQNAVSKESVETHLGDLYYAIRFASIDTTELLALEKKYSSVLTPDIVPILHMALLQDNTSKFTIAERHGIWKADSVIVFDRKMNTITYERRMFDTYESAEFTVASPLLLGAIGFVEPLVAPGFGDDIACKLYTSLEIIETSYMAGAVAKSLLTMQVELLPNGIEIMLTHPVLVRADHSYAIRLGPLPAQYGYIATMMISEYIGDNGNYVAFAQGSTKMISSLKFNNI